MARREREELQKEKQVLQEVIQDLTCRLEELQHLRPRSNTSQVCQQTQHTLNRRQYDCVLESNECDRHVNTNKFVYLNHYRRMRMFERDLRRSYRTFRCIVKQWRRNWNGCNMTTVV